MNALSTIINYYNESPQSTVYSNVARTLLENLDIVQLDTIYEWAERCNVSTATMSRFSQKVGFKNFGDMKSELLHVLSNYSVMNQYVPLNQIASFSSILSAYEDILRKKIDLFFEDLNEDEIMRCVNIIRKYDRIRLYIHGVDINQLSLQQELVLDGKSARSIRNPAEQLDDIDSLTSSDLVIITLPNVYEKTLSLDIMRKLHKKGIPTLLITNSRHSSFIPYATYYHTFEGTMTMIDDTVFYQIITVIAIKYREIMDKIIEE